MDTIKVVEVDNGEFILVTDSKEVSNLILSRSTAIELRDKLIKVLTPK